MNPKISAKAVALLGAVFTMAAGAASATVVSVSGFSGPWDPTNPGNFDYGVHDQLSPTTIGVTAGATITVAYQAGLTSAFSGAVPTEDALGYTYLAFGSGAGLSQTGSSGTYFPSYFISGPTGSPIYLSALIGDFVDSSGVVLEAFAPGDSSFSVVAPTGAVALQLGVNDDIYSDNSGALSVLVTGANSVPEPETWELMLIGIGGVGAVMRSRRKQISSVA